MKFDFKHVVTVVMLFLTFAAAGCAGREENLRRLHERSAQKIFEYGNTGMKDKKALLEALDLIKAAIKLDGKNKQDYIDEASVYVKLGKYQEALNSLNTIIELKQDNPELYAYMGVLNDRQGDSKAAKQDYEMAVVMLTRGLANDEDRIDTKLKIISIQMFISGRDEALREIGKLRATKAEDKEKIKTVKKAIESFDKEKFMDNL